MNGSTLTSTETSASSRKRVRSSSVNGDGPKRVRTTFGQDQLSSLHECFKRTHKPNSVELRQLIHRTGLSKRVLQVSVVLVQCSVNWFAQLVCWFIVFLCILFSLSLSLSPFSLKPIAVRFGFRINVPNGFDRCATVQWKWLDHWLPSIPYHSTNCFQSISLMQPVWLRNRNQTLIVSTLINSCTPHMESFTLSLFYTIRPSSIDSS